MDKKEQISDTEDAKNSGYELIQGSGTVQGRLIGGVFFCLNRARLFNFCL